MDYDTTFGNKIQVSDPTDACFLFLNGIPTEEMYYRHSETIRSLPKV